MPKVGEALPAKLRDNEKAVARAAGQLSSRPLGSMGGSTTMKWTAWRNGRHNAPGVSYGFRVSYGDRNSHFNRNWTAVLIELPSDRGLMKAEANIAKRSFWEPACGELITSEVGTWFRQLGLVPWPPRKPPVFNVTPIGPASFRVEPPQSNRPSS